MAVQRVERLSSRKEIQKLTRMLAALNHFAARSSDKCRPMFFALKKRMEKVWGEKCDEALAQIKKYLSSSLAPPLDLSIPSPREELVLFLAESQHAASAPLTREQGKQHLPIYFISKTLLGTETRYLPLEKLVLALVCVARKLRHYFQAHMVRVLTKHPLRVLQKADLSRRLVK